MKKLIFILLIVFLISFSFKNNTSNSYKKEEETRGIYISYIEYMKYFDNKDNDGIMKTIDDMIDNIYKYKFNLIILHVRPFSDSVYDSHIFPYSFSVSGSEGVKKIDILDYFINKSHSKNIKVFAWINPYRIRNTIDISEISVENPAYKWINTNNVHVINDTGIYYNPASSDVEDLIVNGVKEIVSNYNIDGINFDDYFYPSLDIDDDNYKEYIDNGGDLDRNNYRLDIINKMIKRVYKEIKSINKNVLFSISPDANIDNNYDSNFADIYTWLDSSEYVDLIMPQLYYGFTNSNKPFVRTLIEWNNYIKNKNIKMIPVLAFYKLGKIDNYAGSGKEEWINDKNIIFNQIKVSRNMNNYSGFIIFNYDSFFSEDRLSRKEREKFLSL